MTQATTQILSSSSLVTPPSDSQGDKLPNLDFLRSVAVSIVVGAHLATSLGTHFVSFIHLPILGLSGVYIFFVHTCLVLMKSMERQLKRTKGSAVIKEQPIKQKLSLAFYADFIIRRIFRLYPLSMTVVTGLFFAGTYFHRSWLVFPHGRSTVGGYLANLFLVQNLTHSTNIIGPLWSLPVEFQMYLLLPLLFFFAKGRSLAPLLGVWMGAMGLAVIRKFHPSLPELVGYLPVFIPGVICWRLLDRKPTIPFWIFPVLLFFGLLGYTFAYDKFHSHAFLGAPFCLALAFLIPSVKDMTSTFGKAIFELIARYSYGIYLTHMIVIWFAFTLLHNAPKAVEWLVFGLGLVAIPVILYHLLEIRFIKIGSSLVKSLFESGKTTARA